MAAYVRNDARAIIRHAQSHSQLWWWYVVWGSVIVSIALLRVHLVTNLLGSSSQVTMEKYSPPGGTLSLGLKKKVNDRAR